MTLGDSSLFCNCIVNSNGGHTWSDNKVREVDIREIAHYEFVPTGQSTKFTIWKY